MLVSTKLLSSFNAVSWEVHVKARLAVLRLRGDNGDLDIWSAYLPASSEKERLDCIKSLVANVAPRGKVPRDIPSEVPHASTASKAM